VNEENGAASKLRGERGRGFTYFFFSNKTSEPFAPCDDRFGTLPLRLTLIQPLHSP
jgi:hypothetical protein